MIGCGGIAKVHLQSYKQIKQKEPAKFEFTAMCDPVTASAKQFADQAAALQDHKPKVYTSVLEMLAKEESTRLTFVRLILNTTLRGLRVSMPAST